MTYQGQLIVMFAPKARSARPRKHRKAQAHCAAIVLCLCRRCRRRFTAPGARRRGKVAEPSRRTSSGATAATVEDLDGDRWALARTTFVN